MYQVSSSWLLHDIPSGCRQEIEQIRLRGYDEEFIKLPGDFAWKEPLSVDDIASDICPVRKDLYNSKARGLKGKQKNGRMTWGRLAGMVVEKYCTGLLGEFDDLYAGQSNVTYQTLINRVDAYSQSLFAGKNAIRKQMKELEKIAAEERLNSPQYLELVLQYSARNELAFLTADWILGGVHARQVAKLAERLPIVVDKQHLLIHPDTATTGISDPATPDFLITGTDSVGDVKSGKEFKHSHQMTCTGYALARENELGSDGDTNIGIIYFIETHGIAPVPARAYFFAISDVLRRAFIDKRNRAYNVLSQGALTRQPPDINAVDRAQYCVHCKFLEVCDRDRNPSAD
jgi:CRISPR/Cas system-associated exonuclease Cas4 (RecB family)